MSLTDKILSPDTETFSTPPTTPGPFKAILAPSLSRRNSRPTSLHIDHKGSDWNPDIQLLPTQSPDPKANGNPLPPIVTQESTITPASPNNNHSMHQDYQKHANSPCFVHSQLDKGAHLTDWLKNKQSFIDSDVVGVAKSLQYLSSPGQSSTFSTQNSDSGNESDDEYAGNLTKRLAETAVGVREMSKQLGRARVQSNIHNVLIITKARDNRLIKLTRQLALYLMIKKKRGSKRGLVVYVDNQLRTSRRFDAEGIRREYPELFDPFPRRRTSSNQSLASYSSDFTHKEDTDEGQLRYWTSSMCSQSPHLFDFVVTLGGDGTVLFTSWLFQRVVPPVLPFALGSLGFLTNFDFANYQSVMDSAIDNGIRINLRMRFTCTVYRAVVNEKGKGRKAFKKGNTGEIMMENLEHGWEALEGGGDHTVGEGKRHAKDKEILCFTTRPVETFEVLNDLVVDRGPSPYVSQLELFGDEHHMTTVQADGLTVSTPTGSTAYSLSAGGSLVHPEIPAILITPICPHTLSFRPMLLPDSMELRICVPHNSRSTAWASFDGRGRVELKQGDHIKVTASKYPFPTVCADKQSTDWFHAISRTLKWNERERQKSFVMVEEEPLKEKKERRKQNVISGQAKFVNLEAPEENLDEEEDDCSEEEEDKFDIDDSSPEANINEAKDPGTETDDTVPQIRRPRASSAIKRKSKSRSRSRPPPMSGVNSPSRYGGPTPHLPHISPRYVGFDGPDSSRSSPESEPVTKSAKERLLELEAIKTPTPTSVPHIGRGRGNSRVRPADQPEHRAFAVWGHDESDSNASDNESVY